MLKTISLKISIIDCSPLYFQLNPQLFFFELLTGILADSKK